MNPKSKITWSFVVMLIAGALAATNESSRSNKLERAGQSICLNFVMPEAAGNVAIILSDLIARTKEERFQELSVPLIHGSNPWYDGIWEGVSEYTKNSKSRQEYRDQFDSIILPLLQGCSNTVQRLELQANAELTN